MMKYILFGDIEKWNDAVTLMIKYRPDIQIAGLCSLDLGSYIDSEATVTLRSAVELYQSGQIDGIINIHGENPYYFQLLKDLGFSQIYMLPATLYHKEKLAQISRGEALIYPYRELAPELMQIEFHLADHCNLNCKGCTHFSNLVPGPVFSDPVCFQKDIAQLSKLFSHIHNFYLLGGEPLLNPDVTFYIHTIRKAFPYTQIMIVTNGLLLLSMKEELISSIHKNNVHLSISDYNCLDHKKILAFIKMHQLSADLRIEKDLFSKFLNPKGDSDAGQIFEQCPRKNCTFLGRGRIAACCLPFVAPYFNHYFGESIPELESIDLYEPDLDGWEVQQRLITPMNTCSYCTLDVPYVWEISKPPFAREDWCV